ncbi:glycosyltransferase [Candidatus Woesearchaeota archaeon]|nr:glycosyltransferase [Candidatus Woesearchaeota archaeon]
MATLSLCMIVKDEERFLRSCLDSVKEIADEMIIVDTGSTDRTKDIAAAAGARVFDFRWNNDFSAARNFSLKKATSNWILVMDADEVLDDIGRSEVTRLINTREHCLKGSIGFKIQQRTYSPKGADKGAVPTTDTKTLSEEYTGYRSSSLVRLFRNNPDILFRNKVHELVEPSIRESGGEILDSSIVLHHFSLLKKDRLHSKAEDYADLMWRQLEQEPENPRYNRQVALAFMDKGRKDLALKYFMRTLRLDPDYPGIFADLGRLYVDLKQPEKAIKYFNMAIAKDKRDISSLNNLAVLYMNFGKDDVAKKVLEMALEKEPNNRAVLSNFEALKKKTQK